MTERPTKKQLTPDEQKRLVEALATIRAAHEPRPWDAMARPKQLPPDNPKHCLPDENGNACGCDGPLPNWEIWMLLTGRGFGKTQTGANWVLKTALEKPNILVAVCAPTFGDVKNVCFDSEVGIVQQALPGEIVRYNQNGLQLELRNGSIIQGYTAEKPESIRGANLHGAWFDEIAFIRFDRFFDFGLMPALRKGNARLLITTTPKRKKLLRELISEAKRDPEHVHITHGRSDENPEVAKMVARLGRSYADKQSLLRQELGGEFIEEADGALFTSAMFDESRIHPDETPDFRQVIVAIDPATTSSDSSDETGIVVAAEGYDHDYYTLEDLSMRGTPDAVMKTVAAAFHRHDCNVVVGEKNAVGDYMRTALFHVDPHIPFRTVQSMRGKVMRAQPVSVQAEQGRIHMIGTFDELERQLCAMTADDDRSVAHDDRADAWVHAMRYLGNLGNYDFKEVYGFVPCRKCGQDVNERVDKACRNCGEPVEKSAPEKGYVSHSTVRWSNAYYRTCDKGHEYPMRMKACPQCKGDPAGYLTQVAKLSGKNSSWVGYNGRNWFSGRKI